MNDVFAAGLLGLVDPVPAGFIHQVLLVGGSGINNTMWQWGNILLSLSGKQRTGPDADIVISKLSYWTDNGGYYYYNTEPTKTYEQTMIDVKHYLVDDLNLPIQVRIGRVFQVQLAVWRRAHPDVRIA